MTPVAGGVQIQAAEAVQPGEAAPRRKGTVAKLHQEIKPNLARASGGGIEPDFSNPRNAIENRPSRPIINRRA